MNRLPRGLSFAALCGVSVALWVRPLLDTFTLALGDDKYTHIILILPVTAALIAQDWRDAGSDPNQWNPGVVIMILSVLVAGAARWGPGGDSDLRLAIEMVALVAWWIASFVLCFGRAALKVFGFPLFFLLWMVPVPRIVLDRIVAGLQFGSELAAQLLFVMIRVPVSRDGTTLLIPGLDIDVTPECSSIRSSLMLVVTTMVVAHLLLRTPWRKALLVALAIPLSVAKNGLRIVTIGMLGIRVDPSFLTGRLHRHGGIVFFLIALAVIFLLLWILRRGERMRPPAPQLSPERH